MANNSMNPTPMQKQGNPHEEILLVNANNALKRNDAKMEEREADIGPRERLKRYRAQVAGNVWIPEMWGPQDFLKEWIDCSKFDSSMVKHKDIMSARSSLMQQARMSASSSTRLALENSC